MESPEALTDIKLVEMAKNGDQSAYATLYERHHRKIFHLLKAMFHNDEDAEDATQEAFACAFKKLDSFRGESAFSSWLCRTGINAGLMELRKRGAQGRAGTVYLEELRPSRTSNADKNNNLIVESREQDSVAARSADIGKPENFSNALINKLIVEKIIPKIPPGYQNALVLHELFELEHWEVAQILGTSVGNAKSACHFGKKKFLIGLAKLFGFKVDKKKSFTKLQEQFKPLLAHRMLATH